MGEAIVKQGWHYCARLKHHPALRHATLAQMPALAPDPSRKVLPILSVTHNSKKFPLSLQDCPEEGQHTTGV